MALNKTNNEQVAVLSRQLLSAMCVIEEVAKRSLGSAWPFNSGDVFVSAEKPMLGNDLAAQRLMEISQSNHQDVMRISGEPYIAYVLAEDNSGRRLCFYFARGALFAEIEGLAGRLVSYRSPLGRLAEFPAGERVSIRLPEKQIKEFEILERVRLYPIKESRGWDGTEDKIESNDLVLQLNSLLDFLEMIGAEIQPEDIYGLLLDEAQRDHNVKEGLRRHVIGRMSLRDQPVLDRYQGEIFRLPLNRRLFLSGPPGTGKTTTLIRRLAQKRSADALTEEELETITKDQYPRYFHPNNWLMFTPTELLRLYLKEAFAKEGIASPDERVLTWTEQRRLLGRDIFRVLRSEYGGRLVLDDGVDYLAEADSRALIAMAEDFQSFFRSNILKRYIEVLGYLDGIVDDQVRDILDAMSPPESRGELGFDALFGFCEFREQLRGYVKRLSLICRDEFITLFNGLYKKNKTILTEMESFMKAIAPESDIADEDSDDDVAEDDEELEIMTESRMIAVEAFRRAIFARATSLYEKRSISRASRNWKVIDWFDKTDPEDVDLVPLGERLAKLRRLRFLSATHKNLIALVPSVFQRFRRTRLQEGKWYNDGATVSIARGRISGSELDTILYVMLKNARRYLSRRGSQMLQKDTNIDLLENLKGRYVTQVLVDEVTDFSPVQVACMMELAEPQFRSCFMCGDVMQRVTKWGISDPSEFEWISDDCEFREVTIGYRMSGNLIDLAKAIASIGGGRVPILRAADGVKTPDIRPILREDIGGEELAAWMCSRICEIERSIGTVPSIAIFTEGDDKIDALLHDLKPMLAERNLEVIGCKEGQSLGTENKIRIFDAQYVKGLEFEAVFFVGVDELVKRYPGLYDKLLFVGTTRAATFLGITCYSGLPRELMQLKPYLSKGGWE